MKQYAESADVEVVMIARGKSKTVLKSDGIKIITPDAEFVVQPGLVSDDAKEIGLLDLLIVCTKTYDLESALMNMLPVISNDTYILPLVNGVNAKETIRQICTTGKILNGFVYIVASLAAPGIVKVSGKGHSLNLGSTDETVDEIQKIWDTLKSAGINAVVHENIVKAQWEKFFFISTMATITSYLDTGIHGIADEEKNRQLWKELLNELKNVATLMEIPYDTDIINITLAKGDALPPEATTSMYRDYKNGNRTEIESLTGYVVREANDRGVPIPLYTKMYQELLDR